MSGARQIRGPALLVQTFIFAEDHLLLMQRGVPPYECNWAPPGGFVEPYESAEAAALREIREEVGLDLDIESLLPLATASVSSINQVYIMYIARLGTMLPLSPAAPEALDARWFPESAFPLNEVWEPFTRYNMAELFERVRTGRFEYHQRTDEWHRVISEGEQVRYVRK